MLRGISQTIVRPWRVTLLLVLVSGASLSTAWVASSDEPAAKTDGTKVSSLDALREFNGLIGGWRGVGQLKRASQQGAWQEKTVAVWELKPKSTGIRLNVDAGKHWKSALLGYDAKSKKFTLKTTLLDDTTRDYQGQLEEQRLVLLAELFGVSATASAMDEVMKTGHVGAEYVEHTMRFKRRLLPSHAPLRLGNPALDSLAVREPDLAMYDEICASRTKDPGEPLDGDREDGGTA